MAYKCNTCNGTSDEVKECCGAPMAEEQVEVGAEAPAETPTETPTEGETPAE